jgi:predicted nucleic acid-binding Zn finger protein
MTAEEGSGPKESLRKELSEFSGYGRKFEKALSTVLAGGVKESRFAPSGRRILTVVGKLGDEFIDPQKPYCSCSDFFFKVVGGKEETCYHLLSHRMAARAGRVDVIKFSDEEYAQVLRAVVMDVFDVMNRS